jgi:type III pantothenate kinase
MRLIAVDIGNSSTKFAIASDHGRAIGHTLSISNQDSIGLDHFSRLPENTNCLWVVCSVHTERADELRRWVSQFRKRDQFHLIQAGDIPLPSNVQSRELLGRDRLLGAWQARQVYPGDRLVVIDAGTAVTVDLVQSDSVFAGGVIFPGAKTMLRILARQTTALPDLSNLGIAGALDGENIDHPFPVVGRSTKQAILRGVYQTQLSALKNIVATIQSQSDESLQVVATGGGFIELKPWLPNDWIFDPLLILKGALSIGYRLVATK